MLLVADAVFEYGMNQSPLASSPVKATAVLVAELPPISVVQVDAEVPLLCKTCPAIPTAEIVLLMLPTGKVFVLRHLEVNLRQQLHLWLKS